MTNKTKLLSAEIDKALLNKDFDFLYALFLRHSFTDNDVLIFYKRKINSPFLFPEFWKSNLPHFYLERILESEIRITFYKSYFEHNAKCNEDLNKHLLYISSEDFIRFFKLWNAYKHSDFLDSFRRISTSDTLLERVIKELDIIIEAEKKIIDQEQKDELLFLEYSLGKVIMAFNLYQEAINQDKQFLGNKSFKTSIDVTLISELNRIFQIFRNSSNAVFFFSDKSEIQKEFLANSSKISGSFGLYVCQNHEYSFLFSLITRLIERNSRRGQISLYLSGYADFENIKTNPVSLKTNWNYRIFKINNHKSMPEEYYFSNITIESIGKVILKKTDISRVLNCLYFYGIPRFLEIQNISIDIEKVLSLLIHFSIFKGSLYIGSPSESGKEFIEKFGSCEALTLYEYEDLIDSISGFFKWTESESKTILEFLSFDITSKSLPPFWVERPFLRHNNKVLWLGSFSKDRRWENVVFNKLKNSQEYPKIGNLISKNLELQIEKLFKKSGFKTISGERFKSSNGQSGDFDVLAIKDNFLFVCEVKSGGRSDDFNNASYYESVRLEGCAAEQLHKSIFNIKEDWENIKSKLFLEEEISIESLEIIPLIITDFFEGDLQLYKNNIRKISLLELDVLLKNKKKDLLALYLFSKTITDSLNPNIKQQRSIISDWDLWYGKETLDVKAIIKNIDSNSIWKEIEQLWKFDNETFWMKY